MCCAMIWRSTAPSSAAVSPNMAPAPCWSTARRRGRACCRAAGALVLGFTMLPRLGLAQGRSGGQPPRLPGSLAGAPRLDAWLRINADGTVVIFTGKVELGQGIKTALAQIAAEELEVKLGR